MNCKTSIHIRRAIEKVTHSLRQMNSVIPPRNIITFIAILVKSNPCLGSFYLLGKHYPVHISKPDIDSHCFVLNQNHYFFIININLPASDQMLVLLSKLNSSLIANCLWLVKNTLINNLN